jgi:hypothetical protein
MAIGSEGEIGVQFARWGEMDAKSQQAWFDYMREQWGGDLLRGYAKVIYRERTDD